MSNIQKLKIGFVLDDGLDRPDGVQQYVLTLGNWLSTEGHEVHYLVGQTKRTDIANIHAIPKNLRVRFNGNVLTIPLPVPNRKIKKLLTSLDLDVLHVQVPYSPFFGAKVVRLASARTIVIGTFHIFPYGIQARVGTSLLGLWLQRNLRRFDAQLAVSSAAQSFAMKTFRIQAEIVPNMVDTDLFAPKNEQHKVSSTLNILFLGRLVERKGCDLLLHALADVRTSNPEINFHLNICGRGSLLPKLQSFVDASNLAGRVTFHGFVSEEQKILFMQQADVAVFPSYAGESFGIVLIEAMAAGSGVVLGGNNSGYASVLSDAQESLIDITDQSVFATQLAAVLSDAKLRTNIRAKQELLVKKFDVSTVGAQVTEAYTSCIELKNQSTGATTGE